MRGSSRSCLVITFIGFLVTSAGAATWTGPTTGSGAWNNNANWTSPATFPNGVDAAAIFPNSLTGNLTVNLTQAITVGSIDVSNSGTTQVLTIANGGGSLLFDVTSGNAAFTMGGTNPTTNNVTVSASVTLNDTLDFTNNNTAGTGAATGTFTGTITGAGGFIKDGPGRLTMSTAAKAYNGATTINQGRMRFTGSGQLTGTSGVTVNSGGQLYLDQSAGTWAFGSGGAAVITINGAGDTGVSGAITSQGGGANTFANPVALGSNATIDVSSGSLQLNGIVSGGAGSKLTVTGSSTGQLILASTSNSYSGGSDINSGILQFAKTAAMPATGAVAVNNGGTLAVNVGGAGEWTVGVQNVGNIAGLIAGYGGQAGSAGQITWNSGSSLGIDTSNAGGTFNYGSVIGNFRSGPGTTRDDVGLTKLGTGTLILSNANTYTGTTRINAGALQIGASGEVIADASPVSFANIAGAVLNLNNQDETVASLAGGGTTGGNVTLGSATLTLAGSADTTYAGAISGTGGVIKKGSGTQTFSTANTFNGTLSLNGGAVSVNTVAQLGAGNVSFNGGALRTTNTSQITSTSTRAFSVGAGGATFNILGNGTTAGTFTIQGTINGDGNITKTGIANSVNTSVLQLSANNSSPTTGFGGKYIIDAGELLADADANFGKVPAAPISDYFTLDGGYLRSNAATITINSNRGITLGPNGGGFDTATATVHTLAYNGVIAGGAGSGGLTKQGPQSLSLGGANTFTGNTRSAAGTLILANSLALQNSTLDMNSADSGAVTFGTANATLGGLAGSRDLAMPTGTLSVGNNGGSTSYSGILSGIGSSLSKIGSGILTLSGANIYAGGTSVTEGTLLANNTTGSATGTGDVNVQGGKLGGTGSISGNVNVTGGKLAPGASINSLAIGGNLAMSGGSFDYEINSTSVTADLLTVAGNFSITGAVGLTATDLGGSVLALGTKFTLINYAGTWNGGTFTGLPNYSTSLTIGANRFAIRYDDPANGSNFTGDLLGGTSKFVTITAVPEAGTFLTVGLGGIFAIASIWMSKRLGINVLKA